MADIKGIKNIVIETTNPPNLDKDWKERITYIRSHEQKSGTLHEFSYTGAREYRMLVMENGAGFFGTCSCPYGMRKAEKKPCKHMYSGILYMREEKLNDKTVTAEALTLDVDYEVIEEKIKPVVVTKVEDITENEQRLNDIAIADEIRPKKGCKKFWPSKLDMIEKCPASQVDDGDIEIEIDKVHFAANIGRAVHKIAESVVSGEITEIDRSYIVSESIKFGVEEYSDDVETLAENVVKAWNGNAKWGGLKGYFINPKTEEHGKFEHTVKNPNNGVMENISISGYMDVSEVISAEEVEEATVKNWGITLDWKSGRKGDSSSYKAQMLAYATMLAAANPKLEQVTTIICWLRDNAFSVTTFSRDEIRDWFKNFIRRSAFWDGKSYSPGEHCSWCKRYYDCPARAKMINSAVTDLIEFEGGRSLVIDDNGDLVDPDKLYQAFKQAKSLEKLIATFIGDLKFEIEQRGSVAIPSLEGNRGFSYKTRRGNAVFDSMNAWPVLQEHFTDDEIAGIVNIGKGNLKKAADNKAPRGKKASFLKDILSELEANGAVRRGKDVKTFGILDLEVDNE